MKKHIKIISILAFFIILISVSSCELGFKVDKPNIYMISMGCDFPYDDDRTYPPSLHEVTKAVNDYGIEYDISVRLKPLIYTINDAVEVGKGFEALAKKAGYNFKIQYLIGPGKTNSSANYSYDELGKNIAGKPTYENFCKALTSFSDIKSSDILIFYVSSHGGSAIHDADAHLQNDSLCFYDKIVSFNWVKRELKNIKATILFVADTCYSGTLLPVENGVTINPELSSKKPIEILFNSKIKESAGFYCLTAGTYNEMTYEEDSGTNFGHGKFTRGLLNALGWNDKTKSLTNIGALKNNKLTVMGIAAYVHDNVERKQQHSQAYNGSDDIILFKF